MKTQVVKTALDAQAYFASVGVAEALKPEPQRTEVERAAAVGESTVHLGSVSSVRSVHAEKHERRERADSPLDGHAQRRRYHRRLRKTSD